MEELVNAKLELLQKMIFTYCIYIFTLNFIAKELWVCKYIEYSILWK